MFPFIGLTFIGESVVIFKSFLKRSFEINYKHLHLFDRFPGNFLLKKVSLTAISCNSLAVSHCVTDNAKCKSLMALYFNF